MAKKLIALTLMFLLLMNPMQAYAKTYNSKDSLLEAVRKNLIARKTEFTLETTRAVLDEIGLKTDIAKTVLLMDNKDTSKDSDYLGLSLEAWSQQWEYVKGTTITYTDGTKKMIDPEPDSKATFRFEAVYRTSAKEERAVDTKIKIILKSLKLENASEYDKVKAIHDYIINLASYDKTLEKGTAYHMFVDKTGVCSAYTAAAYRLFTDAGLECRVIRGKGDGEPHAWNIVKVDGKWYNIDLTWDDPIMSDGSEALKYDYFLKNTKDFVGHTRDAEYNTKEFLKLYPIAKTSYKMK